MLNGGILIYVAAFCAAAMLTGCNNEKNGQAPSGAGQRPQFVQSNAVVSNSRVYTDEEAEGIQEIHIDAGWAQGNPRVSVIHNAEHLAVSIVAEAATAQDVNTFFAQSLETRRGGRLQLYLGDPTTHCGKSYDAQGHQSTTGVCLSSVIISLPASHAETRVLWRSDRVNIAAQ